LLSNKVQAILAIVATLLFVALIALQVVEMLHYSNPPSVWPV
jgi:hypothetical protein